jgi:hypothetical protein
MAAGWVCALAAACGPTGSDAHGGASARPATPQTADGAHGEPRDKQRRYSNTPILDGTRCAAFVPFVPNTFEGYRAKAAAEGKDIDLGEGASLALIRRGYWKPGSALEIEVVDAEQAKSLRDLFDHTRELERNVDVAVIKPISLHGYKALAQWNSTSRAARVSVLVESRYLVNLSLRPSDGIAASVALADKLDLAALAQLPLTEQIAASAASAPATR